MCAAAAGGEQGGAQGGVLGFLRGLGLQRHWGIFQAKGYDRESDLPGLGPADTGCMNIPPADSVRILRAVRDFRLSASFRLQCWLEEQGLGHYYDNLRRCDVTDLEQLTHMTLDPSVYSDLEMDVPGHRRRFSRAVTQLRKRRRLAEPEDAICRGFWGKPEALVSAKNDFLCLTAELRSTRDPTRRVTLEFMVDSGSDVVTVRQETLNDLDLELIGTCQSQGVHASRRKQLYRGVVVIGGVCVQTEVMAETYECVGNQVLRNFRHYIDAHDHFWMRSEHCFLPPSDLPLPPSALPPPSPPPSTLPLPPSTLLPPSLPPPALPPPSLHPSALPPPSPPPSALPFLLPPDTAPQPLSTQDGAETTGANRSEAVCEND